MKALRKIFLAAALSIFMLTVFAVCAVSAEVIYTDRHLVRYDSGVVFDTESGLEWFAGLDRGTSWEEANSWVDGLDEFGGGWRMPVRSELDSLYHVGDGVNNITYLLTNSGYWIWAGKTWNSSSKWIFSFSYGGEGWNGQPPDDGGRALAVRQRTKY
ncbi:MAG: DUF1566 domain-containing protein [Desulfobacterales bacterium]